MKTVLTLIAVLAIVSVASASTVGVTWTKTVAPNGMDSYTMTFTGSAPLQAFDGSFTGAAINNLQPFGTPAIYADDAVAGLWAAATLNQLNDSEFLLTNAGVLNTAKAESATSLSASFGIVNQAAVMDLARIVVPTGQSFVAAGTVAVAGAAAPFSVTVPEPVTMSLLAFGGLGLLARRKR